MLSCSCGKGLGQRSCISVLQPEQTKSCRHDPDLKASTWMCSPGVWGNILKEKGHRKGAKSDTVKEGIIKGEAPTVPSFFFSLSAAQNLIHLFWEEKSLPHSEYWLLGRMFCVRFVNSEKYFPFNPKGFMETKMSSLPDVFPLLVT